MRQLSRLVLAIGYVGGGVLLLLLLAKGDADLLTARVAYTAVDVIVIGLIAAAAARLIERPDLSSLWGAATLLFAAATFVLVLVEIWRESGFLYGDTRLMVAIAISFLLGGGCLVLSGEPEADAQPIQISRLVALASLAVLGLLTVLLASDVDVGPRWFGVASLAFLVSALSLPLLRLAIGEEDRAS
jgi:hypothetical protein